MPERVQTDRPKGIIVTTLLMAAILLTQILTTEYTLFHLVRSEPFHRPYLALIILYPLVFKAAEAVILSFCWRGRDWALWAVLFYAALTPLTILFRPWNSAPPNAPYIIETLLALFLLYFLNTRPIRAWFK